MLVLRPTKVLALYFELASRFIRQLAAFQVLYIVFVRNHLEFSSEVWLPHQRYLVEYINKIQMISLEMVFLLFLRCTSQHNYYTAPSSIFGATKRLTWSCLLYQVVNGLIDCHTPLELVDFRTSTITRSSDLFTWQHHGTENKRNSNVPRIQRKANLSLRDIDTFCTSIHKVKMHLLTIYEVDFLRLLL